MATAEEYESRIQGMDHAGLLKLLNAVVNRDTPDWEAGKAFEYLILRAFQLEGAVVIWPYSVRESADGEVLEQIDGAVIVQGLNCLVEAKDQTGPLNVEPIAKIRNQLLRRPAGALGLAFSRSGFTQPAETLARYTAPQTILLWQGSEIDLVVTEKRMVDGLLRKYRYAVTHGWPNWNLESPTE